MFELRRYALKIHHPPIKINNCVLKRKSGRNLREWYVKFPNDNILKGKQLRKSYTGFFYRNKFLQNFDYFVGI